MTTSCADAARLDEGPLTLFLLLLLLTIIMITDQHYVV